LFEKETQKSLKTSDLWDSFQIYCSTFYYILQDQIS
jgi:hypothetical protein